jgi:hypothetical protein
MTKAELVKIVDEQRESMFILLRALDEAERFLEQVRKESSPRGDLYSDASDLLLKWRLQGLLKTA